MAGLADDRELPAFGHEVADRMQDLSDPAARRCSDRQPRAVGTLQLGDAVARLDTLAGVDVDPLHDSRARGRGLDQPSLRKEEAHPGGRRRDRREGRPGKDGRDHEEQAAEGDPGADA